MIFFKQAIFNYWSPFVAEYNEKFCMPPLVNVNLTLF